MFQTSPRLLAGLLTTSAVVSMALAWSGWRLLEQQRDLDGRLASDRAEAAASAMAAGIRERLADLGDQLDARLTSTTASSPALPSAPKPGVVIVVQRSWGLEVEAATALPYVPVHPAPLPPSPLLAKGEAAEFSANTLQEALDLYTRMSRHTDPFVRAGALLRVGRVLRKIGRAEEAIPAYERLAALGDLPTDTIGVPASLVALDGQRLTYRQIRDATNEQRLADEIRRRLDDGEWRLARGTAEFYRDEVSKAPRPDSWQIASALSEVWPANPAAFTPRGYSVVAPAERSVLVVWRTDGMNVAMGAAWLEAFVESNGDSQATMWQLADADDRPLAGTRAALPASAIPRVIAAGGPAWTLRVWPPATSASASGRGPMILSALVAMLSFVWGATYFMARAIRREAAVARLQSDFVAAVSHEFRTPLSTMRQMTEMLETDRVPVEARRRQYYGVLATETSRLQRLVETLLNFGRLEAGVKPYHFVDLEVTTLVDSVISEMRSEPGHVDRRIVPALPDSAVYVHGDEDAIRLAVRNLIDNAIKYSPPDSTVRVSVTAEGNRMAIAVSDEGAGIAANERRAIFGKFVRGLAARQGHVPGTGVGLAIVQRIVSAHEGDIRLTSELGRGSTFTLLLPLVSMPGSSATARAGQSAFTRQGGVGTSELKPEGGKQAAQG